MSSPVPPIRVPIVADDNGVAVALRELVGQLKVVQTEGRKTASVGDQIAAGMTKAASGTAKWEEGLRRLSAQQQRVTATAKTQVSVVDGMAGSLKKLAAGYGAVQIGNFVRDSIQAAGALHDLAQRTGATVETLSVLAVGARRADLSSEDLAAGFKGLSLTLGQLRKGNEEATKTFGALGLAATDFQDLSVDQSFQLIVDRLARLPDGFEKAEAAQRIFGRSGAALIPLLNELAGDGFTRLRAEAESTGQVISGETAAAADKLGDSLADLVGAVRALSVELAGPALGPLAKYIEFLGKAVALIKKLPSPIVLLPGGSFLAAAKPEAPVKGEPGFTGLNSLEGFDPVHARTTPATEEEIRALAKIREAGRLDEGQKARVLEVVKQLNQEYAAATGNSVEQAKVWEKIKLLTHALKVEKRELTDTERQHLEHMRAQAQEAGRLLKAEAERRRLQAESLRLQQFQAAVAMSGGYAGWDDFLKRSRERRPGGATTEERNFGLTDLVAATQPETIAEAIARQDAENRAAVEEYVRQLKEETEATAASLQLLAGIAEGVGDSVAFAFLDSIERLGDVTTTIEPVLDHAGNIVKDEFGNTVEHVTRDVYTLGDAFMDMARDVVRSIQLIAAELLRAQIVSGLGNLLGLGGIPGAPDIAAPGADTFKLGFATGGSVPGVGTGDTVPAMLTPREFVQPTRAVDYYGSGVMEAMRRLAIPREAFAGFGQYRAHQPTSGFYATGGIVTSGSAGRATVELVVPDGYSGRVASDDDMVRVIVRNRRLVRDIVGGRA